MTRKVLLVEPNYKNKYPPLGLMKLATYHKMLGDDVAFYKGSFDEFIKEDLYTELLFKLIANDDSITWNDHRQLILEFIVHGHQDNFAKLRLISNDPIIHKNLAYYRNIFRKKEYFNRPKWDRVCISTLFTFYWRETISTINNFKKICKSMDEVWIGGTAASVVPEEIRKETGINPFVGLLDKAGILDKNKIIIDHLPLDYSILNEIDYKYSENNGYYGYMTRGCTNKCKFCAVPKIEPIYSSYISIKEQVDYVKNNFGEKQNLLLLDNNVLASNHFDEIIDEIKACGFLIGVKYLPPNEYEISINGLRSGYNDKGYLKRIIDLYKVLLPKLSIEVQREAYSLLRARKLANLHTASREAVLDLDPFFSPLFHKKHKPRPRGRFIDFNQGIDARLLTQEKAKRLSEIPIMPLRIAFDSWSYKDVYEKAVRIAASEGIKGMSNYLLYNYDDKPVDLYRRIKINVDLCEELGISIYSFPMKYHPIQDPKYFRNRSYLGKHWNRKFIRSVQAVLNATKGKIGKGKSFFEAAFGKDEEEFNKILFMPESLIIYRYFYKENGITDLWWNSFNSLSKDKLMIIEPIILQSKFDDIERLSSDQQILEVLKYYTINRDDTARALNSHIALKNIISDGISTKEELHKMVEIKT